MAKRRRGVPRFAEKLKARQSPPQMGPGAASPREMRIRFKAMEIRSQQMRTPDRAGDHLDAVVKFDMEVGGRIYRDCEIDARQTFQSNYEEDPIEVAEPRLGEYRGPCPRRDLEDAAIDYCRSVLGAQGQMFEIGTDSANIGFQNIGLDVDARPIVLPIRESDEPTGGWLLDRKPGRMLGLAGQQSPAPDAHLGSAAISSGETHHPDHQVPEPEGPPLAGG